MFSIGQLAARTGVKIPTIRYYEQMGLLDAAGRSEGNQRRYSQAGLDRLAFIKHARDLGLSITMIRDLIDLGVDPDKPCEDAHRIAAEHLALVRERIGKLRRLERELARIEKGCHGSKIAECYVLSALSDHDLCDAEH